MTTIFFAVTALLLVALNGFFVAAEFGLVKLRQTRIRAIAKTQGWRGRVLAKVHGRLDAYLSACQLGITLASLGLGWIGEPAFADLLAPLFERINLVKPGSISPNLIHGISFVFAFSFISFLHIVVGELAPKSMAIRSPEKVGLFSAVPLYGFYWLMYPAIWLLNASANLTLRVFGLDARQNHDTHYTADELKLILRSHRQGGQFTREEWNILANTLDFSELQVADLMRPIHEISALYRNQSLQENLRTLYSKRFSRYPYFDADGIDVLGVIHLKDLFFAQQEGKVIDDLQPFLRPIHLVSPRTPALELFRKFRAGSSHFAIIGRKGSKPLGFLTMDNLLSAMVGEIRDEFRKNSNEWTRLEDGSLVGKASLPIFSLERILGIDIENEELELEDEVSVGGLILAKLRDIPAEGQIVEFKHFNVVVKKMNQSRIVTIQIHPIETADQENP
jgi:CBS domain containing-hemolysin-like protein